jgi:tetratricopeptide (TPR) repeat protein
MKQEPRYQPGDKIGGRYRVHDVKMGGMGEIYFCLDEVNYLPYALKTFQHHYTDDIRFNRAAFEKEISTWIALEKHPNIVRCFYMDVLDSRPFMFLEWITGEEGYDVDLRSWLHKGEISIQLAFEISIDICRGMVHALEKHPGLVHRDLKPENILISQGRIAKITDFGLAEIVHDIKSGGVNGDWQINGRHSIISGGGFAGTPAYMSPEQWRGETLDQRTDIYALGCIMFEMLTGQRPFNVQFVPKTPIEFRKWLLQMRNEHEKGKISSSVASMPPSLEDFVRQCLSKRREDRPENFNRAFDRLTIIYRQLFLKPHREIPKINSVMSAIELHNRATTYIHLRMYDVALSDLNKAIELAPTDFEIYTVRGALNIKVDNIEQAFMDLNRAIELNPEFAPAYANRYSIYTHDGKYQEAMADINEAIRLRPNESEYWHNRAALFHDLGDLDKSEQDLTQAIQLDPLNAEHYRARCRIFAKTNRQNQALADITRAISLNPLSEDLTYRSVIYSEFNKNQEALDDINQAIRLSPTLDTAYRIRAEIYMRKKDYQAALKDFDYAISLKPEANTFIERSLCRLNIDDIKEAFADLELAQATGADKRQYYLTRGKIYQKQGNLNEALNEYNEAISLEPENAESLYCRGDVLGDIQQFDEALLDLNKAILLKHNYGDAILLRGEIYEKKHSYDDALLDYDTVIGIEPYRIKAYEGRGNIFRKTNQLEKALLDYNFAIGLDPENVDVLNNRGNTYADLGLYNEALGDYEKVIQKEPGDPMVYYNRATVFFALQQYDDALADYNNAIHLNPNYKQAYSNRGGIQLTRGKYQEALDDFSHALELEPVDAKDYYNIASVYIRWNKLNDALSYLEKAAQLGLPTAIELVNQIKEKLADGTASEMYEQQHAFDLFWKSESLEDIETAISNNPIILRPGFFLGVYSYLDQPISSDIKAILQRNLNWLYQIIMRRAFDAFQQSNNLSEMRDAVNNFPIMVEVQFINSLEQYIQQQVEPEHRSIFEQKLDWLKGIANGP